MFTCDRCKTEYVPTEESAVAHLYLKDPRCNHIEARCSNCGATEIIYLGPQRLAQVLTEVSVTVAVYAEADPRLRVRAERAWAAAHEATQPRDCGGHPAARSSSPTRSAGPGNTLREYELTPRHEEMLSSFGAALTNIPDELLWDSLQGEHHPEHPARWTD